MPVAEDAEMRDFQGGSVVRLSHRIEQFILAQGTTTVGTLARHFRITKARCWQELGEIVPYGVVVRADGTVIVAAAEE